MSIDKEWELFLKQSHITNNDAKILSCSKENVENYDYSELPKCDDLYISTTTKVLFLNEPIDIDNIFWKIPIVDYWKPESGVIKKQMKIVNHTKESYESYCKKLVNINYYSEHIIKQIDNPNARRNKFKDERKITIGMSKKDIMNCRGKVKNAFYNCFALILRFIYNDSYHEIHAKIFNTGKMEIPGILNNQLLEYTKIMILELLKPLVNDNICFIENTEENSVLINSNFNCGFYINREKLYSIIRDKYNIECAYDPCSYPGVKCKFYYNNQIEMNDGKQLGKITYDDHGQTKSELSDNKKYTEVSFMIFRTGSCLIVGNCTEPILRFVYDFIKDLLQTEYPTINTPSEKVTTKPKQEKIRKKNIEFTHEKYKELFSKN